MRRYNPKRDRAAVHRIWSETGWMEKGQEKAVDLFVECGRAIVAEVNRQAECLATAASGTIRYLEADLPLSVITAVTTSRIARKQGLAGQLTARLVAEEIKKQVMVSCEVEIVDYCSLPRSERKSQRIFDNRPE